MSEKKYLNSDTAYDAGTLSDWYISSVDDSDPIWTDAHIDELVKDFYVIPKDAPSADVAPVVYGRWVYSDDLWYMPQCTNCGAHPFKGYIPSLEEVSRTYKFCPCCGAKMDYERYPYGTMTLNPDYTEILRLDKLLTEKGIDHTTQRFLDGYRIGVNYDKREIGDAVEHYYSYGSKENLLETMGFGENDVTGHRTAEDVMTVVEAAIERKRGEQQ